MQPTPLHALVAEDDPATAGALVYSLEHAGFQVTWARNGLLAISYVEAETFDIIFTDFQMPGAEGEDVIRAARASSTNRDTPMVLCSAKGMELDTVAMIEKYRLETVLYKPFSPIELIELAKSVTARDTQKCASAAN